MTEFARIFTPRAAKAVKAISLLTNGARYEPTQEEKDNTLSVLKDAVNDIASLYGMLPGGQVVVKDVPPTGIKSETSEQRITERVAAIDRGEWPRLSIDARVRAIPENQLSSYVTQIMARMCDKFDDAKSEAQPKNYLPKE